MPAHVMRVVLGNRRILLQHTQRFRDRPQFRIRPQMLIALVVRAAAAVRMADELTANPGGDGGAHPRMVGQRAIPGVPSTGCRDAFPKVFTDGILP